MKTCNSAILALSCLKSSNELFLNIVNKANLVLFLVTLFWGKFLRTLLGSFLELSLDFSYLSFQLQKAGAPLLPSHLEPHIATQVVKAKAAGLIQESWIGVWGRLRDKCEELDWFNGEILNTFWSLQEEENGRSPRDPSQLRFCPERLWLGLA